MKVKKIMVLALSVCLSGCMIFSGCGKKENKEKEEDTYTLRVAMECAYSPFNWTQENAMVNGEELAVQIYGSNYYAYGYDIMLAKEICDYYGWNLEVHKVDWTNIVLGLQNNEYDVIIGGMKKTEEREQTVDFSQPYFDSENCLVVAPDSPYLGATSLSDVSGISCTAQMNTAMAQCIQEIPDVNELPLYSSLSECVMSVTSGAAEACVLSITNAKIAAKTNDIEIIQFEKGKGFSQETDVCMAVNEGNQELIEKLNTAMEELNWSEKMDSYMDEALNCAPVE